MDWIDWAKAIFGLTATLALIGLCAIAARRFGMLQLTVGARPMRRLRVVESLMLDPRRRLVVVRLDQREHVLLLSPAGDRVVAQQDAPPEQAATTQAEPGQ